MYMEERRIYIRQGERLNGPGIVFDRHHEDRAARIYASTQLHTRLTALLRGLT